MRSLYVRIIGTTMLIMVVSGFIAFIASNSYYHYFLKPKNDAKVTDIAENIVATYETTRDEDISTYLQSMASLGYKIYLHDQEGNGATFGDNFSKNNIAFADIKRVLAGENYHGIANFPRHLLITGFFDNDLKNTIGVPIEVDGEVHALFVRADTAHQFGEVRIFLSIILVLVLLFTFLLILFSTSFIVKPITDLTIATKKIAAGNYHIKLNENRKDEIGRLARDFTKMSDNLAKTEDKRQEFVSNVSHEIQSPLTSIQGFSQALKEEDLSKEERRYFLSIIEKESKRLSLLSKQLLTLSFLDSETEKGELVNYNVADQLDEVVSTMEWQWRKKDIAISVNASPMMLTGDPKLLYQVWMNLLANAIRYTNEGGMVTVQALEKKESIEISFEDTGIGIAEEDMRQIFDRFYKVDKARTRTHSSTGLGLSIVKKIIELHNGTIMIESSLEKGSTFIVSLPKINKNMVSNEPIL